MELSVGGIISKSFEMVKGRFGSLVGMWFVYFALQIALMIALFVIMGASVGMMTNLEDPAALGGAALGGGMILFILVFYLGYILIYCAQTASLNALASPLQQLGFGDAFSVGLRSALPLLGVIVLLLIGYFIGAFAFGLVIGVLSFAGKVGAVIGALAALVLLFYLASRLSIIFPTVAVERVRNPITAIGRSWSLTKGNVLPIFLAMLVYAVIVIGLCVIVLLPVLGSFASLASGNVGPRAAAPAFGGIAFMLVGFLVIGVFVTIFNAAMQSVIHAQLSGSTGEDLSETFG